MLHGSFMVAAWLISASIGTLLPRYMKKTWVGKQLMGKDMWFFVSTHSTWNDLCKKLNASLVSDRSTAR